MGWRHEILVAAHSAATRTSLKAWFAATRYNLTVTSSFHEGRDRLSLASPDLLVTEVKLGEYNGLQLAARARQMGTPAIVIGPPDIVLERDAEQLDALYVSTVRKNDLLAIVEHVLALHASEASDGGWGAAAPQPDPTCRFLSARRTTWPPSMPGRSTLSN